MHFLAKSAEKRFYVHCSALSGVSMMTRTHDSVNLLVTFGLSQIKKMLN